MSGTLPIVPRDIDPELLEFDPQSRSFLQVPETIDPCTTEDASAQAFTNSLQPYLKLLPRHNPATTPQAANKLDLVNSQANNVCFVSERSFESGVHNFELVHLMDFKDVKIGIFKDEENGSKPDYSINLSKGKLTNSVVVRLDMENKKFSILFKHLNFKRELNFKSGRYKFFVTVNGIGNFVSLNPFYAYKSCNSVWSHYVGNTEKSKLKALSFWSFIENVEPAAFDDVGKFLEGNLKKSDGTPLPLEKFLFDKELKIIAFSKPPKVKSSSEKSEKFDFVTRKVVKATLASFLNLFSINKTFVNASLLTFIEKNSENLYEKQSIRDVKNSIQNMQNTVFAAVSKTFNAKSDSTKFFMLESSNALLAFNGVNKLKILKARSSDGSFIISPFIFRREKITISLSKSEFNLFFKILDWNDVLEKTKPLAKEIELLKAAFDECASHESIVCDNENFFLQLQSQHVKILVETVFEYINIVVKSVYTFNIIGEEEFYTESSSIEQTNDDAPIAEGNPEEDHGLGDLFNEPQTPPRKPKQHREVIKSQIDNFFKSSFETFPTEFDNYLNVVFKMEEALYLQSTLPTNSYDSVGRSHTAFGRLFSFINSGLSLYEIEKLVDFGIYINSSFLSQFKHYKHEEHFYCDFNDKNISKSCLSSYELNNFNPHLMENPADNVTIDFSISHRAPFTFPVEIENVFVLQKGKLVVAVGQDKNMWLFSTRFGLSNISKINFTENYRWENSKLFSSVNTNAAIEQKDYFVIGESDDKKKKDEDIKKAANAETEEQKLINSAMLDQLYQMGFPIELSKKALLEVKSISLDAALSALFKLTEESLKQAEKPKGKTFQLMLKPEWDCKACTYINSVLDNPSSPNICIVCGQIASEDAYFEELADIEEDSPELQTENSSKICLKPSDKITQCQIFELQKENLLNHVFLVFIFERDGKQKMLVSRLALSSELLKQSVTTEPKSSYTVSLFGQYLLKKGSREKDLGKILHSFFLDKIINIMPSMYDNDILKESNRQCFDVNGNAIIQKIVPLLKSKTDERGFEYRIIYLTEEANIQEWILTNKAKNYASTEFDFEMKRTINTSRLIDVVPLKNDSVLQILHEGISSFNGELSHEVRLQSWAENSSPKLLIDFKANKILVVKDNGSVSEIDLNTFTETQNKKTVKSLINLQKKDPETTKNDSLINPKSLLSFFKTHTNLIFNVKDTKNLLLTASQSLKSAYSFYLSPLDSSLPSSLVLQTLNFAEGVSVHVQAYFKVSKDNEDIKKFLSDSLLSQKSHIQASTNSYQKLALRAIDFKGAKFSKSHHLSQMLIDDGEYFATKHSNNLFIFENLFERIMKIKKVSIKIPYPSKRVDNIEEILVFVFNDLSLANNFVKYKNLSHLQIANILKNSQNSSPNEPCACLYVKDTKEVEISAEFETERLGRYVAILPLKPTKGTSSAQNALDCFQYISVEGEYISEHDLIDSNFNSAYPFRENNKKYPLKCSEWNLFSNEKNYNFHDFSIEAVKENTNEFNVKAHTTLIISGENLSELKLSIPAKNEHMQLIGFNTRLSNISNTVVLDIKEQFKKGPSEKFSSFLKTYNDRILQVLGQTKENDSQDPLAANSDFNIEKEFTSLIELIIYSIESFGPNAAKAIIENLDLQLLLQKIMLKTPSLRILQLSKSFFDKLINIEIVHEHISKLFRTTLNEFMNDLVTSEGLSAFWQMYFKFITKSENSIKAELNKNVLSYFYLTLGKIRDNNITAEKLLRTFGFSDVLNGLMVFNPDSSITIESSSAESNSYSTALGTSSFVKQDMLINYSAYMIQEKNYSEIVINCKEIVKLDSLLIKFGGAKKLVSQTIDVFFYCPDKNKFKLIKSKHLTEDFVHQISGKKIQPNQEFTSQFDLGFNFSNVELPAKLIKIIVKVNHIAAFDYTDPEYCEISPFIFGKKVQDILSVKTGAEENNSANYDEILKDYSSDTNLYYTKSYDEIDINTSLKPKLKELESQELYASIIKTDSNDTKNKREVSYSRNEPQITKEIITALEEMKIQKELLESYFSQLNLSEANNFQKVNGHIGAHVLNYKKASSALQTNQAFVQLENVNYEANLSFWLLELDLILKEFGVLGIQNVVDLAEFNDQDFLLFVTTQLFYDVYLYENSKFMKIEELILALIKKVNPDNISKLVDNILQRYLEESEIVFAANINKFVEKLKKLKLTSSIKWQEILKKLDSELIPDFEAKKNNDLVFKEIYLDSLILVETLKEEKPGMSDIFDQMISYVIWMLGNRVNQISKKFEELISLLLTRIFNSLNPELNGEFEMDSQVLQLMLSLIAKNKLIPIIDKIFSDFEKSLTTVSKQGLNQTKTKAILEKLRKTLMSLVRDEIINRGDHTITQQDNIQDILFFSLSHIKSLNDLINLNTSEEVELERTMSLSKTVSKKESLKKKDSNQRAISSNNAIIGKPVDRSFSIFVEEILGFITSKKIEDNSLISTITNFAINEQLNKSLLLTFLKFTMQLSPNIRPTIIYDLAGRFTDIFKKMKTSNNKTQLRDFSTITVELLIYLLHEHKAAVIEDLPLTHFCINLTLHIINENDSKVVGNEACKLSLKHQVIVPLFCETMELLIHEFNYGGPENFQNFHEKKISLFELTCYCLHILVKGVDESGSSLLNYFTQNFKGLKESAPESEITSAFESMCIWTLCNSTSVIPDLKSVIGPFLKKILTDINQLYFELIKREEAAKILLNFTCDHFKNLFNTLAKQMENEQLGFMALYMVENSIEFMESLLGRISKNEILASHFLNHNKGLEFVFEILNKTSNINSEQLPIESQKANTFFENLKNFNKAQAEKNAVLDRSKNTFSANKDKPTFEEEYGNKIKQVNDDKTITNGSSIKEWHVNKVGRNASIYNTAIVPNKKSITLKFKASEGFEFRTIKLALTVARSENYMTVGPSPYVHMYALIEDEKKQSRRVYLGELEKLDDSGYFIFNSMVYVLNPNRLYGKNYAESLENIKYLKEITAFELVISRPLFTVIDKISPLCAKSITAVNLSINFLSIDGFSHTKVNLPGSFQTKVRNTMYNFIDILFNSEAFTEPVDNYLDNLNKTNNTELFGSIELQLDSIMQNFNEKMSRFLMIISEKNKNMADSIFTFLMRNIEEKTSFFDLIEKILKKTNSYKYLFEFFEFGKKKLLNDIKQIDKFLKVITTYLVHIFDKLKDKKLPIKFALPIDDKMFRQVINYHKSIPFNYHIQRFIVVTIHFLSNNNLYTVFPLEVSRMSGYQSGSIKFEQDTKSLADQFLAMIWEKIDAKDYIYLPLISYIALKSPEVKEQIIQRNTIKLISEFISSAEEQIPNEILLFLQTITEFEDLHISAVENQIDKKLITALEKQIEIKDFRTNENLIYQNLKAIFYLFKNTIERRNELENILFEMLKVKKNDSFFIENVLLKFFDFELTKKTQFALAKKTSNEFADDLIDDDLDKITAQGSKKRISISSTGFNTEKINKLAEKLNYLVDEKTEKDIKKYNWKKVVETSDGCEDFSAKLESSLYNKQPILILIHSEYHGEVGVFGMFAPEGFIEAADQGDYVAYVPNSDNTFLFFYSDSTEVHYKPSLDKCDKFLQYSSHPDNKIVSMMLDSSEKVLISMIPEIQSTIDLYPMKPIPEDQNPDYEFPYDNHINRIEIFQLDVKLDSKTVEADVANEENLCSSYLNKNSIINAPYSFFEESIVYDLQNELTFRAIKDVIPSIVLPSDIKEQKLGDLEANIVIFEVKKDIGALTKKKFEESYNPLFPIFEVFLDKGGMKYVIETIKQNENIPFLKDNNLNELWRRIMDDLLDLQKIEGFLSSMIQNREFLLIMFELFIGGSKSDRNWQEAEFLISSLIFEKLSVILKNTDSVQTRTVFFEKDVLKKLLDKLRSLTNELTRTYNDTEEQIPEEKPEEKLPAGTISKDEPFTKEVRKRKGVGYDKEGSGKKWLINEYLAKKKLKNEFMVHLLKLFNNLFAVEFNDPKFESESFKNIKESWFNTICESCFLPLLESAMKSSSLHEMAKEYEVYEQYCECLLTLSRVPELKNLLKPIPLVYKPQQLQSLLSILQTQEENTNMIKKFSQTDNVKPVEGEEKIHSMELATLILSTIDKIKKSYPDFFNNEDDEFGISQTDVDKILSMGVNDQYKIAMKNARFDLVDMKKTGQANYDHHYNSNIIADPKTSSQSRMVRLAQEIADLTSSLPVDSYNAITVRADTNRLDVIKTLIAGAEGTPYANGLFEYHVYLPNEYPNGPPKCNLETTGSGDVRFNPNLYSCGKVCLSLLGTWRGSASENWDPKISNLLQLFLSIQSVVMSEDVYFNEPGYEGEAGTEEGEKKNEGYSNIVRLCNIKFAMIKQIKSPIIGFEDVIRRHFYIKRDVILKECGNWVKMAEIRPCAYTGLVSDHNHKYSSRFSSNNKNYVTDLRAAITDLEETLKELVSATVPQTSIFSTKRVAQGKSSRKAKAQNNQASKDGEVMNIKALKEKIDTTWDENISSQKFDAEDEKVSDRWSRYIGVMGIEAVKKQSIAKVAVIGINSLGLEIAKNIVLSGVNTLTLIDWANITEGDLLGNFYASSQDIGKNRAEAIKKKLEQLNFYVKVESLVLTKETPIDFVSSHDIIVITDNFSEYTDKIIDKAKHDKKKLIISEALGVYSRIFCDFGEEFYVNDRDGEEPSECYIKDIDHSTNRITLFEKSMNQLRNGDYIVIDEISTNAEDTDNKDLKDLNGSLHKVKEMHKMIEIEVEDLSNFKRFSTNGKIKEIKVPVKHQFLSYDQLTLETLEKSWDENLKLHDFEKIGSTELIAKCFLIKERYEKAVKLPFWSEKFEDIMKSLTETEVTDVDLENKLRLFWINSKASVHPVNAFIGGLVAQEIIKGITGKFTPIKQLFCTEFEELLDETLLTNSKDYTIEKIDSLLKSNGKYGPLTLLLGAELLEELKGSKVFMVGSGAIGCELLKNYAMIGLGSKIEGGITLTDPDNIELSNLSRQFLFREKHISKPKSLVAASVVETMNEDYKDKIAARLEKVHEETENVFSDEFFASRTLCLNALDNVKARIYMDQRCVRNHIPLLESGTLGPKGHVQVILPNKTENYSQVQDANEEQNIPVCTLKMFPEEALHCMEWAKDRFEFHFSQQPKTCIRVLEEFKKLNTLEGVDMKMQKTVLKFLKKRPTSLSDSIDIGRKLFQKYFYNKIKQLMHVYPLDFAMKDGKLFWTLPKRPPIALEFTTEDELSMKFVESFARLNCRIWSLPETLPSRDDLKKLINEIKIEPFHPKDSAAAQIRKEVEKNAGNDKEVPEETAEPKSDDAKDKKVTEDLIEIFKKLDLENLLKTVKEEIFEKDADKNGHVDFIHSTCNLRVRNYKLPEMEWISVKLKAGRIVPALATTTAAIAGLQTIEAIKVIKKVKIEKFRNAFLNIAIPTITLSEPGPAAKHKIHENLTVDVWDQWTFEFDENSNTLKHLFDFVRDSFKVEPIDLFKGNKPIFLSTIAKFVDFQNRALDELVDIEKGEYCLVTVICKLKPDDEKSIEHLPPIKLVFK